MARMASKYAVVELNKVAGVRTGEIISQYKMADGVEQLENGMLVAVDHAKEEIKLPTDKTDVVYLHASVEKLYDGEGRNQFVAKKDSFLPRLYKLCVGDTFETNAVDHEKGAISALASAITETAGFGVPDATGNIKFVDALDETEVVALKAIKVVTLPNGEAGIKFTVIKSIA